MLWPALLEDSRPLPTGRGGRSFDISDVQVRAPLLSVSYYSLGGWGLGVLACAGTFSVSLLWQCEKPCWSTHGKFLEVGSCWMCRSEAYIDRDSSQVLGVRALSQLCDVRAVDMGRM
jgi:hypothetical protein